MKIVINQNETIESKGLSDKNLYKKLRTNIEIVQNYFKENCQEIRFNLFTEERQALYTILDIMDVRSAKFDFDENGYKKSWEELKRRIDNQIRYYEDVIETGIDDTGEVQLALRIFTNLKEDIIKEIELEMK